MSPVFPTVLSRGKRIALCLSVVTAPPGLSEAAIDNEFNGLDAPIEIDINFTDLRSNLDCKTVQVNRG